ncbi:TRAP transporter small permease subunit [Parvularcula dongshanensis]|uniref:TRAP transporter small permease protein n=1 Tax=Parvularcula dongshanensis TaxID=1173995 RepID=A0A840I462_9PROT|nr:TRAP transporter small permease subunit [Parvularcula dongshanensis]MBB4659122.1 TRAP-type mannitol/chloroaromatic compound transport system permease small subunit [Parvularcula dongshanensis]
MLIVCTCLSLGFLASLPFFGLRSDAARQLSGRLAGSARRIVLAAFVLACCATLLLALAMGIVVLLRSVFSISLVWLQELPLYLFGATFLLSGGAVLLADAHVRVDVLYSRWPPRRRALVDLCGLTLFVLPVCGLIVVAAGPYVAQSWADLERSPEPSGIHAVYLLKSLIPAFGVLVALAAFVRADGLARGLRR